MSKQMQCLVNGIIFLAAMVLITIQVDVDGELLVNGYHGLDLAFLLCAAGFCLNVFRGMQLAVYGEEF